jgi:hypothetical protein
MGQWRTKPRLGSGNPRAQTLCTGRQLATFTFSTAMAAVPKQLRMGADIIVQQNCSTIPLGPNPNP